ncbi:MAG: bacillithiol biosynthesis cysteine-adding enzyme BshC [Bacteroidia bacterium]|nr:bacillithiol biosynthesis cysteine-adding enzyme BshC [Bacteroidia bacterium]
MDKTIPFSQAKALPKLVEDYINNDSKLESSVSVFPDINYFDELINNKNFPSNNRQVLVDVLKRQYKGMEDAPDVSVLLHENTFTITTGHQLNIFTGPAYFIYKIISAIKLASQLSEKYTDNHFIPVYWMATEDHDIEEIRKVNIFNKELEWDKEWEGAVGEAESNSLEYNIGELQGILKNEEYGIEMVRLFRDGYEKHKNLAQATRYIVQQIFADYNLIIVDANEKVLKELFAPVIEDELFNSKSYHLISDHILTWGSNYKAQVNPREINLFYMNNKSRDRIVRTEDERWEILDKEKDFVEKGLRKEISQHPERFSPNVVLRPLYQEMILPNLAYVGGAGELSYWLQLKPVFDNYKVQFPMLVLRDSYLWVDSLSETKLDQLGVDVEDIFENENEVVSKIVAAQSKVDLKLDEQKEKIAILFDSISTKFNIKSEGLLKGIDAEKHKAIKGIDNIENKIIRDAKKNNEVAINKLDSVKKKLLPNNKLQERVYSCVPQMASYGTSFLERLYDLADPLQPGIKIVREQELENENN